MSGRYILGRDYKASLRLNHQHYEFTNVIGYLLHPSIPVSDRHDLKIADVGTGTGIWAVDVARQLPRDASIDGYDISSEQFPPSSFLPPNVKLHGDFDIFEAPPPELCGIYDVVHVRLVVLVVEKDPSPVIRQLTCLLKPGGYLQWSKIDVANYAIRGPPNAPRQALNDVLSVISGPAPAREEMVGWLNRLAEYFSQCGLVDCRLYKYKDGPSPPFNAYVTLSRILTAEEISKKKTNDQEDLDHFALTCQKAVAET